MAKTEANIEAIMEAYDDAMEHTTHGQVFNTMGIDEEYMREVYRNKYFVVYSCDSYGYDEVLEIEDYGENPYGL